MGTQKVGWVKADTKAIQAIGKHVITHNHRVSVSQDTDRSKYHLHISNASMEESGPYICQLNTDPMKSQLGILTVYKPADIVRVSELSGVVEGGEARLTCEAEGFPRPKIYWTREEKGHFITIRDRHSSKSREVTRVTGSTLILSKIKRSQMGNYLCIASNGFQPAVSRRVRLNVNFRPVVTVQEPTIYAKFGEKVILGCLIEAFPLGIYYWESHRGHILSESSSKHSLSQFTIGEYKTRSQLTLSNFTRDDIGTYTCICKNAMTGDRDRVEGRVNLQLFQVRTTPTTVATTTFEESFDSVYRGSNNNIPKSFEGKSSTAYMVNTPSYDGRDIYQSIGSSQAISSDHTLDRNETLIAQKCYINDPPKGQQMIC